MRLAITFAVLAACSHGDRQDTYVPDASPRDTSIDAIVDVDADGLADDREDAFAREYLPFVSLDPGDGCALSGFVARVRKHPADPTKILIVYSHLFQRDCGLSGHVGDNEGFGIAIDPTLPPPMGIIAMRTASHQNTPCQRTTECSTCANDSRPRCDLVAGWPVLYASKDKHGQYVTKGKCSLFGTCFDQCTLNPARVNAPVVNVGEPGHPRVTNLSTQGFITAANGWTEATLMHADPWDAARDFGGAGNVAGDLQDATFEPALCP